MSNKIVAFLAPMLLLMALGLAGCNTTRGLGQDVEALGDAVEEEAEENKTY